MPHKTLSTPCAANLGAHTPAFVHAPTFVFGQDAPALSRSEMLRLQIIAAQESRRPLGW
ncbi:hypothetical protein [Sphingomonas endophytica]|uniref:hypothetical protein n=1 Tax=Sphingomonas endophytica TaxID=869719 RepID=UPI000B204BF8|nr:hypothetical protein [Sphingomonas endophytica]